MAKSRGATYGVGQTGEHLVAAELGRRGVVCSILSGNAPDIDILAFRNGHAVAVQVKAISAGGMHAKADRYLEIQMDGDRQVVLGKKADVDRALIFVVVFLGNNAGEDRFYVLTNGDLQDRVETNHKEFLALHDGIRPKNPKSMHTAVLKTHLSKHEGRWDLVLEKLGQP